MRVGKRKKDDSDDDRENRRPEGESFSASPPLSAMTAKEKKRKKKLVKMTGEDAHLFKPQQLFFFGDKKGQQENKGNAEQEIRQTVKKKAMKAANAAPAKRQRLEDSVVVVISSDEEIIPDEGTVSSPLSTAVEMFPVFRKPRKTPETTSAAKSKSKRLQPTTFVSNFSKSSKDLEAEDISQGSSHRIRQSSPCSSGPSSTRPSRAIKRDTCKDETLRRRQRSSSLLEVTSLTDGFEADSFKTPTSRKLPKKCNGSTSDSRQFSNSPFQAIDRDDTETSAILSLETMSQADESSNLLKGSSSRSSTGSPRTKKRKLFQDSPIPKGSETSQLSISSGSSRPGTSSLSGTVESGSFETPLSRCIPETSSQNVSSESSRRATKRSSVSDDIEPRCRRFGDKKRKFGLMKSKKKERDGSSSAAAKKKKIIASKKGESSTPRTSKPKGSEEVSSVEKAAGRRLFTKEGGDDPGFLYEECTVQAPLRQFFRSNNVQRRLQPFIDADVLYVTKEVQLFYAYLGLAFREERNNPDFFIQLAKPNAIRKLYKQLRDTGGKYGFQVMLERNHVIADRDGSHRSYIMNAAIVEVTTNVNNTIMVHLERHLLMYFKRVHPIRRFLVDKINDSYVKDLLESGSTDNPWNVNFKNQRPLTLVPALLDINEQTMDRLQELQAAGEDTKGVRTFRVSPEASPGLIYVHYNKGSFTELLNQVVAKQNASQKEAGLPRVKTYDTPKGVLATRAMFKRIINFRKFERPRATQVQVVSTTGEDKWIRPPMPSITTEEGLLGVHKKFALKLSTNGYSASLAFRHKVVKKPELPVFTKAIGVDVGYKNFTAVTVVDAEVDSNGNDVYTSNKVAAKKWHHATGYHRRQKELKKIIGDTENVIATDRERLKLVGRSHRDHKAFLNFQLKHLNLKRSTYIRRKYLRLIWRGKVENRRRIDLKSERMAPRGETTAVYYGNGPMTSTTGGHQRCPLLKLREGLERIDRCRVFDTDEFRTSKLCCRCFAILVMPRCPSRFVFCRNCGLVANRDINASHNIVRSGRAQHHNGELPSDFQRSVKMGKDPPAKAFSELPLNFNDKISALVPGLKVEVKVVVPSSPVVQGRQLKFLPLHFGSKLKLLMG